MIDLYDLAGQDAGLRFSPYCWRVRLALAHKGLAARTLPWRFTEHDRLPGAPHNRQVPVMVDAGAVVAGSGAIAAYLDRQYPSAPSLFGGAAGQAHAHFILAWADGVLAPALFPIAAWHVFSVLAPADQAYFRATREPRLGMSLEAARAAAPGRLPGVQAVLLPLRRTLQAQSFLGDASATYPDYAVFSCLQWLRCVGAPDVAAGDDLLAAWQTRMLGLFDGLAGRAPVAPGMAPGEMPDPGAA